MIRSLIRFHEKFFRIDSFNEPVKKTFRGYFTVELAYVGHNFKSCMQGRINARASRGLKPRGLRWKGGPLAAGKVYFSNDYLYGNLQQ